MAGDAKNKFDRLISRFLENQVIPFIGAGVSYNAKPKKGSEGSIKTSCLRRKLVTKLKDLKQKDDDKKSDWIKWFCSTVINCKNQDGCNSEKCDLDTKEDLSFTYLCEIYDWISNNNSELESLCEVLGIDSFTSFRPSPAHRYIAFLVREKVIDEIITTNYDNLIEEAYICTFDENLNNDNKNLNNDNKNHLLGVCTNLNEYHDKRSNISFKLNSQHDSYLRVYKINGCAEKYKSNKEKYGREILLTEKQLQDWRERQWAKDLFKDRMRSSTILFSGFGSDEPQVRYTVLQVIEEFVNIQSEEDNDSITNSLFIAGYERELTFNQMQILYSYIKANTRNNEEITKDKIYENAFTGKDVRFFKYEDDNTGNLDADIFWKRIFQAIYWKLIKRYCEKGSPIHSFFSAMTPKVDMLLSSMLNWYIPEDKPFGAYPELLDLNEDESSSSILPIIEWAYYVESNTDMKDGLYIPLEEKPVLIITILMMIFIVVTKGLNEDITWEQLASKIYVRKGLFGFKNNSPGNDVLILLKDAKAAFYDDQTIELPNIDVEVNMIVQVLLTNSLYKDFGRINVKQVLNCTDNGLKKLRNIMVYQIPISQIFQQWIGNDIDKLYNIMIDPYLEDKHKPYLYGRANRI